MIMKAAIIAVLIALAMAAGAWSLTPSGAPDHPPEPSELGAELRAREAPLAELTLGSLAQSEHAAELLDPAALLPASLAHPPEELAALHRYAVSCEGTIEHTSKVWLWHAYQCGHRDRFPRGLFAQPPFIHPAGISFARLAFAESADPDRFLAEHRDHLHLLELAQLRERLDPRERMLLARTAADVAAMLRGDDVIAAGDYVLIRKPGRASSTGYAVYAVYPQERFDALLDRALQRDRLLRGSLAAGSITLLLGAVLALAVSKIAARRAMERERNLMLQMLAHELRTPASSLALSLEPFRAEIDRLPEPLQTAFLRMCDDVQRLHRVIGSSTRYLQGAIELRPARLESTNELVRDLLGDADVELQPLERDQPIAVDPYWLGLCLRNLVDNALAHGARPVRVRVSRTEDRALIIAVEDAGRAPHAPLSELLRPFSRGEQSKGLGLGLGIVDAVIRRMNGELAMSINPTTFSLIVRGAG